MQSRQFRVIQGFRRVRDSMVQCNKRKPNGICMNATSPRWAIRPLTPEEVYTDRQEPEVL
jgi:hypothetical protein